MKKFILILILFYSQYFQVFAQICFKSTTRCSISTNYASSILTGNFNSDNFIDIVAVDSMNPEAAISFGTGTDTFVNPITLSLPDTNMFVAVADLNNDSLDDLCFSSDSIYVFLNIGGGNFSQTTFFVPEYCHKLCTGDFNIDGNQDLAMTLITASDSIAVYPGDGSGAFLVPVKSAITFNLGDKICTGNFDGDSLVDLIYSRGDMIQVMINAGSFQFTPGNWSSLYGITDFACGRMDGDSLDDIIGIYNYNYSLGIIINVQGGAIQTLDTFAACMSSLAIADFDLDGFNDIVTADECGNSTGAGKVHLYFGDGTGRLSSSAVFNTGFDPFKLDAADFNNDGRSDIVTVNVTVGPNATMLLNSDGITGFQKVVTFPPCSDSTGTISTITTGNAPPFHYLWNGLDTNVNLVHVFPGYYELVITAADGCHITDTSYMPSVYPIHLSKTIAPAACGSSTLTDISTQVWGGTPPYTYYWNTTPPQLSAAASGLHSGFYTLTVHDQNGCILQDYMHVAEQVLFDSGTVYSVLARDPYKIYTADLNGDSLADIIVFNSSDTLSILLNNGSGGFLAASVIQLPHGGFPDYPTGIGDFNNDNTIDLAIAIDTFIYFLPGDGSGGFYAPITSSLTSIWWIDHVASCDFNGDGLLDLAASGDEMYIIGGMGNGTFFRAAHNGASGGIIAIVDLNQDGHTDIVSETGPFTIEVFVGNVLGSFSQPQSFNSGAGGLCIAIADYNSDNDPDIVSVGSNGISIIPGDSSWFFSPPIGTVINTPIMKATVTDLDGNGIAADVVAINSYTMYFFVSETSGYYCLPFTKTAESANDITTADFDNNGKVDIAIALEYKDSIKVYMNCTPVGIMEISNEELIAFPNPAHDYISFKGNFSKDAVMEIFDINSRIIHVIPNSNFNSIDVRSFQDGFYILRLIDRNKIFIGRVCVMH